MTLPRTLASVALAAAALLGGAAGVEWDAESFEGTRSEVEQLLEVLAKGPQEDVGAYGDLIARLESEDFDIREAASADLERLSVLDQMALVELKPKLSPEAAMRITKALGKDTTEHFDEMVGAALEAIIDGEMKGLAGPLFRALGNSHHYKRGLMWNRMSEAARATSRPEDMDVLKTGLTSDAALVRGAAAEAILEVAGDQAPDLLLALVDDPDDQVKWMAARSLALVKRRECLKPLAELLMSEEFGLRWRALDELRAVSGLDFGYAAAAGAEEREGPAEKWLEWVEAGPADAELFKPAVEPDDESANLFRRGSLDGWEEIQEPAARPAPRRDALAEKEHRPELGVVFPSWVANEDGSVSCRGLRQGTLRSTARWSSYKLTLEFRVREAGGEGAVGLLAGREGDGYVEIQLRTGATGDLYRFGDFDLADTDGNPIAFCQRRSGTDGERRDDWSQLDVSVGGGKIEVFVDGVSRNRVFGGPTEPRGIFLRDKGFAIDFRNARLSRL